MRSKLIAALLSITLFFSYLSCAPKTSPVILPEPVREAQSSLKGSSEEGWKKEWEATLAAAKREGRIILYTNLSPAVRDALARGFEEETGIVTDSVPGRGGELSQKLLSEHRAGLNIADVYIGGATSLATVLKPVGIMKPLEAELLLPDVKDPGMWWEKRLPFIDKERKYILSFRATPGGTSDILINTQFTPSTEFKSYQDLLNPKWKSKITMQDPTTPGKGLQWFSVGLIIKVDVDFMRSLAQQKPLLMREQRQQVEWVVHNKYPVAIAPDTDTIKEFQNVGVPLSLPDLKEKGSYITAGSGNIVLFKESPHPQAARAFLNWLLTKKGQTVFSKAYVAQSAREDVPTDHIPLNERREPKVKYFMAEDEEFLLKKDGFVSLAKEIFSQ